MKSKYLLLIYAVIIALAGMDYFFSEPYAPGGDNPTACAPCGAPCTE